jgi:hypothetical protein
MKTIRVKGEVPIAIERHKGTVHQHIYDAWKNQPLEPYGKVIKGRPDREAPYNKDRISVRLALPGVAAFSAVTLEEIEGSIDLESLPPRPSYSGTAPINYNGYGSHLE